MRRLSLALSLLLAGCGSTTEPTKQPSLHFASQHVFGFPTLATAAVGGEGTIVVTGIIHTVGTGFSLTAHVSLTAPNAIILEITVQDNKTGDPLPVQNYYEADLGMLTPGDYDLSVIHNIRDPAPGSRLRVYHQTVHVN